MNPEVEAAYNAGLAHMKAGRYDEALAAFAAVIRIEPRNADAIHAIGVTLYSQGRYVEAIEAYEAAIAARPLFAEAYNNLGVAARAAGDAERAVAAYSRATEIKRDYADAFANLGSALTELGEFERARAAFDRASALEPGNVKFMRVRFEMQAAYPGDPRLNAVEQLAKRIDKLPVRDRVEACFMLARIYADLGRFDESFAYLTRANATHRSLISYDEGAMLTLFERVEAAFDAPFLQRHSGSGASSRAPIFIIGMPRSGTTLVEQIFASHPRVRAGGELKDVYEAIAQAAVGPRSYYPEMLADFAPGDFRALGERYLERVGTLAQGDRFTDKMPTNFLYAGAISLMLPNAKIVHVRRDPIDTCLSCFEQFFNESTPHAYDLAELGRYYRAYAKLSEHWRRVLPPESYLEVQYEDVVADFESQARRLLEHAGLEWNPQVLAFHLTRRSVRTASAQQVRRPLYAGSIGRASRFGTKLQPLIDAIRG